MKAVAWAVCSTLASIWRNQGTSYIYNFYRRARGFRPGFILVNRRPVMRSTSLIKRGSPSGRPVRSYHRSSSITWRSSASPRNAFQSSAISSRGLRADQGIVLTSHVRTGIGPPILCWITRQARLHGIHLDVARGRQGVRPVQRTGPEPSLPQVPTPALAEVDSARAAPVRRQRSPLGWPVEIQVSKGPPMGLLAFFCRTGQLT